MDRTSIEKAREALDNAPVPQKGRYVRFADGSVAKVPDPVLPMNNRLRGIIERLRNPKGRD